MAAARGAGAAPRGPAQPPIRKIFPASLVGGPAAMFCFRCSRVCRSSVSVAAYAAWPCGAFSTAKHTGMSGAGDAMVQAQRVLDHPRRHDVFADCLTVSPDLICLSTKRRREWAGSVYPGPPSFLRFFEVVRGECVMRLDHGEAQPLALEELGERYRRYRLSDPAAEEAMARSLRQYGQLTPVTVCLREGRPELLDGFKRRAAAALLPWRTLSACVARWRTNVQAKAAIYGLNRTGSRPQQLEEAWIVQALVREDGLTQVQAAELLDQHKSWVCRRLALLERLADEAKAELRLGLLSPSLARQLTRLPMGNQAAVLTTVRREALTAVEGTRRHRPAAWRQPGTGTAHSDQAARGVAASGRGAGAGPRLPFEPRRQPRGPATALPARRSGRHGELAALSGPGGVEAPRSPAAGAAFCAARPGHTSGRGPGGRTV